MTTPADPAVALDTTTRNTVSEAGASPNTKISAFGVELTIPLPSWLVASLGVGLVAAAVIAVSAAIFNKMSDASIKIIPRDQQAAYDASTFHLQHRPDDLLDLRTEDFTKDDGTTITINHYHKDGCVQIVRWNAATQQAESKWLFGRNAHTLPKNASTVTSRLNLLPEAQAQGRCLDPHPGAFQFSNVPVNQCLVQVWRNFADGCVHFQLYNPCTGTWDVWPNGAPKVTWTRCVH